MRCRRWGSASTAPRPVKVTIAGKGGVGKTTVSALLARGLAERGLRTLAVDCDPNPNLAESFGLDSRRLERFTREGLRREGDTLTLAGEPPLAGAGERLWLLAGPWSEAPLADAIARGIAGVLLSERFDAVVTDLGAGPELAGVAVGGPLNPADVCVILSNGQTAAELAAERIDAACRDRGVPALRVTNRRGAAVEVTAELAERLVGPGGPLEGP